MYFFDGEHKDDDECLENTKKIKGKGAQQTRISQESEKKSKAIRASIFQSMVINFTVVFLD